MTVGRGGKARRGRWVLMGLLASVLSVGALVVYVGWMSSRARKEARVFEERKVERARQLAAKVEAARRALPQDAGIAVDWTLEKWGRDEKLLRWYDFVPWAVGILEAPEALDSRFISSKGVASMQTFMEARLAANDPNPLWARLDVRTHTPDEVIDALGDQIMGLDALRELERAIDHGLVGQGSEKGDGTGWYASRAAADLIAFRAYAEARAGHAEAAATSLGHAFALTRIAVNPNDCEIWYGCVWRAARKTLRVVWDHAPMPSQCRDQLVKVLTFSDLDRLADCLRMISAEHATYAIVGPPGVEEFPTPVLRFAISAAYSAYKQAPYRGVSERALEYAALVPSRPCDVYPRIASMLRWAGWSGDIESDGRLNPHGEPAPRLVVVGAVKAHVYSWRWASLPDILRFAFSVEDYRSGHGTYPKGVPDGGELAPLPVDPATGKPMEYRSDGKTFSLTFPDAPQYPAHDSEFLLPEWRDGQ